MKIKLKTNTIWVILLSLVLSFPGCNTRRYLLVQNLRGGFEDTLLGYFTLNELQDKLGPMKPSIHTNIFAYSAKKLADSLKAAGIDTLLVFGKYSMSDKEPFELPLNFPLLPVAWVQPAYVGANERY